MSIQDERTSNALGVRIPLWIIKQLEKRSSELRVNNSRKDALGTNENLLFRANRTAWVRLVSSVDVIDDRNLNYFKKDLGLDIKNQTDLAKNFVLQGGTSKYKSESENKFSYSLRGGLKDSYNVTGNVEEIKQFGYKPMPGITSVKVETQGKLGSIKAAQIQFKVWDKYQLDVIDALYFKLGYTMFLEWGQTNYYKSDSNTLQSTEDLSINPFQQGLEKEDIFSIIAKNVRDSEGNYDAMLGMVTNFNFTYSQDGGYDCSLKLISLGVLVSSIKINNPRVLPDLQARVVRQLYNTIEQIEKARLEREKLLRDQESADPNNPLYYPPCVRNKTKFVEIATVANGRLSEKRLSGKNQAYKAEVNGISYFFYRSEADANSGEYQTTGYSTRGSWYCDGDQLYIDNQNVDIFYKTYEEILKNSSVTSVYVPFSENPQSQLRVLNNDNNVNLKVGVENINKDYVNKIIQPAGNGFYDQYIAFNKFKALVPTNVGTTGKLKYDVTVTIKLPKITVQKSKLQPNGDSIETSTFIDTAKQLLVIRENDDVIILDQAPDLNTSDVTYTQLITPSDAIGLGYDDFKSRVTYTSRAFTQNFELRRYAIVLTYPGITDYGDSGIKNRYTTFEGPQFETIQSSIEKAISDPTEVWKLDSFTGDLSQPSGVIFDRSLPQFSVTLSKRITVTLKNKKEVVEKDVSGKKVTRLENIDTKYSFRLTLETDDPGIITSISVPKNKDLQRASDTIDQAAQQEAQNTQQIDQTDQNQPQITLSDVQKSETEKYKSAFEVMVRSLQLYSLDNAILNGIENAESKTVKTLHLLENQTYENFTKDLFSSGVFANLLGPIEKTKVETKDIVYYSQNKNAALLDCAQYDSQVQKGSPIEKDLAMRVRALFGFHYGLMGNQVTATQLLEKGYQVDFSKLMTTYTVPYDYNAGVFEGTQLNHPIYLPLGLVVMILNHVCVIYNENRPLVYFDFNNKTNLCLSSPKQLSTNPYDVLIPFQGSNDDYIDILEPTTIENKKIKSLSDESAPPIYTPISEQEGIDVAKDRISGGLLPFKVVETELDSYRGRTMNVLISCDYLLKVVSTFSNNNGSADVYAKEFLEQILFDVNKYLGDVNIFRLAYDDTSNVSHIIDDQLTPNLEGRYPTAIDTSSSRSKLPLFGIGSIAKTIEIRTEVASRLSNMIAISANSSYSDQANLSKNGESFGFYNLGYKDRYVPTRTEYTPTSVILPTDTMIRSTIQFNESIKTFYGSANPSPTSVAHATNYYIQRMSKLKNEDKATRASAMIPVSLNFSVDGMSGFGMGQSFTVDPNYLPYTYDLSRANPFGVENKTSTVAFVIVGLDHTIENNQWTSNVRANMIYAKAEEDFKTKEKLKQLSAPSPLVEKDSNSTFTTGVTKFIATNEEAKRSAEQYLGSSLTDSAWSELVAATFAEASRDQNEEAAVMGVILNRVRTNFGKYGSTVYGQLRARNQFESVTGRDTSNFNNGPNKSAANSIYGAAVNLLSKVPKTYLFFTSANRSLFYDSNGKRIPGRDTSNYDNAVKNYKPIGKSLFG